MLHRGSATFLELRQREVHLRRIHLPGNLVNKGKKKMEGPGLNSSPGPVRVAP